MDEWTKVDHRFRDALNGATDTYNRRLAFTRAGGVLRTSCGQRAEWQEGFPTEEERQEAREALVPPDAEHPFDSSCPSCRQAFRIPSVYISIRDYGMCPTCQLHEQEGFGGTVVYRDPSVEEAREVPVSDLRGAEVRVLVGRI